jgi:hypothetical protein
MEINDITIGQIIEAANAAFDKYGKRIDDWYCPSGRLFFVDESDIVDFLQEALKQLNKTS